MPQALSVRALSASQPHPSSTIPKPYLQWCLKKYLKIAEPLGSLDIVAEQNGAYFVVDGYKWLGSIVKSNPRGEGVLGVWFWEFLFVSKIKYEESVWMKVGGGMVREALYIGYVYMPTDSSSVSVI